MPATSAAIRVLKNPQESCKKPARLKNFLQKIIGFLNFLAGHFVGSCRKMMFFLDFLQDFLFCICGFLQEKLVLKNSRPIPRPNPIGRPFKLVPSTVWRGHTVWPRAGIRLAWPCSHQRFPKAWPRQSSRENRRGFIECL